MASVGSAHDAPRCIVLERPAEQLQIATYDKLEMDLASRVRPEAATQGGGRQGREILVEVSPDPDGPPHRRVDRSSQPI